MTKKLLITIVISSVFSTGCSTLKNSLFKPEPTLTTKPMIYNFIEPRRTPVLNPSLASNTPEHLMYYSANGHKCKTLSISSPRSACLINGAWKESAPVLVYKPPV